MATSRIVNLGDLPAAPAGGGILGTWQKAGSPSGTDPATGLPIYPASVYVLVPATAGITIDGGGSPPTTGLKGILQVPFNGVIVGWSVVADQSGSCSVDIWKIPGSAPPTAPAIPTVSNKISASAPVTVSTAQSAAGGASAISTWSTLSVSQWDSIGFNLSSVTSMARITLELFIQRS